MPKFRLDHENLRAYWNNTDINLTVSEFRVMVLLAAKPGSWFAYRAIYDCIRGRTGFHAGDGEKGMCVNVRSFIKRIRRKCEAVDPRFDSDGVIMNFMGYGYGLNRDAIADAPCCPTCGQIILVLNHVVVPATSRETVPEEVTNP